MGYRGVLLLVASGCYAPQFPSGVPCVPESPNCPTGQTCTPVGGGFACLPEGSGFDDASPSDSTTDSDPISDGVADVAAFTPCPSDPELELCFSFDAPTLSSPLPNEGTANAGANLVGVTRIATGSGGAAMIGTSSEIYVPPNPGLPDIRSIEVWMRVDQDPADNSRVGIVDAETTTAPLSLFYYRDPDHRLRCQIGTTLFANYTAPLGSFVHVACVCNGSTMRMFVDDVMIGQKSGCSPGDGTEYGIQLGQNGNVLTGGSPDEWMIGALDLVRLWGVAI